MCSSAKEGKSNEWYFQFSSLHFQLKIPVSTYFKCVLGIVRIQSSGGKVAQMKFSLDLNFADASPASLVFTHNKINCENFILYFWLYHRKCGYLPFFLEDRKVIWISTLKNCPSFNATFASLHVLLCKHVGQRHHHVCLACADWGDVDEVENWCGDKTSLRQGRFLLEKSSDI